MSKRDLLISMLAKKRTASLAIYAGMIHYLSLWIFPGQQELLLALGLTLYIFRIPYFIKIRENAFVAQSIFFFSVEFVGLFLAAQAHGIKIPECYAIF